MQAIPKETGRKGEDAHASEPKVEDNTAGEIDRDQYSMLQRPSEDIYSEAFHADSSTKIWTEKQAAGKARWYRIVCFLLMVVCVILMVIIIALGVKLKSGSVLCPANVDAQGRMGGSIIPSCTMEQCQGLYPVPKPQCRSCQQCPRKWRSFGDSCFYLSTSRKSWDDSQQYCASVGGSMVVVDSPGLQDFLSKQGTLKYWIGLRLRGASWMWNNNTALGQSYWQGDASNGDCGILDAELPAERNWVTSPCQYHSYFICQQLL